MAATEDQTLHMVRLIGPVVDVGGALLKKEEIAPREVIIVVPRNATKERSASLQLSAAAFPITKIRNRQSLKWNIRITGGAAAQACQI